MWFGTHGASPTWLVDHDEGYATLNEFVFANPSETVGNQDTVPFLLKVLAAGKPLSLQAHPSDEQAREGFARENAAGLHLADPQRNYRDNQAKPELIVSMCDEFVALSGFREFARTVTLSIATGVQKIPWLAMPASAAAMVSGESSLTPITEDG